MNDRDRIRLRHMLEAAAEATAFIRNRVPQDLAQNRILLLALVKEIEIVREAAAQQSEDLWGQCVSASLEEQQLGRF
jgi:uncharacterized protein with HEPN domain